MIRSPSTWMIVLWSWMIILWYPRKTLPRAVKLVQQSHFPSLSPKNAPSHPWSQTFLNQKSPWSKAKKRKTMMITSNRRLNWAIRKDRAAKPLLQRTSYSLPPLNEALKKISNVMSHSKPRPNKSRLHQWDRNQPKHMRNDSLDRSRSKQRQSGWRTSTNLRRFASSETQKKGPKRS